MSAPLALLLALLSASPSARTDPLVDATTIVPELALDLRYATEKNFVGERLYAAPRCLLRKSVALRLKSAQAELASQGVRLVAYDCYRPLSVQKRLWRFVPVRGLVAPPTKRGSNHNRGAAIDVGLVASDGSPIPLPTDFDSFTNRAWAQAPLPDPVALRNRTLLQKAMRRAGFTTIRKEWWHFDAPEGKRLDALDLPL